jgi:hypothetical protein
MWSLGGIIDRGSLKNGIQKETCLSTTFFSVRVMDCPIATNTGILYYNKA